MEQIRDDGDVLYLVPITRSRACWACLLGIVVSVSLGLYLLGVALGPVKP